MKCSARCDVEGVALGVVTNCSEELGAKAVSCTGVGFDVVVTAERAGYYKPDARPYKMALDELGVAAGRCLFVAGSAYDLFGTSSSVWQHIGTTASAWRRRRTPRCRSRTTARSARCSTFYASDDGGATKHLLRQAGGLPGHHLPLAALIGVDVGEADAEAVGAALRHDADAARAGQHYGVAEILRLDVRGLDRGVDRRSRTPCCRSGSAWCRAAPRSGCRRGRRTAAAFNVAMSFCAIAVMRFLSRSMIFCRLPAICLLLFQRISKTSLPCRWRPSLTRCASAASASL